LLPEELLRRQHYAVASIKWEADKGWRQKLRSVTLADLGDILLQETQGYFHRF
jgi:hypothetical protein